MPSPAPPAPPREAVVRIGTAPGFEPQGVLDRLKSLTDETRTRILLLLEGSELTVGEICQVVQIPQSTVSRHLGILANEGWLKVRVDGPSRHYRFSSELDAPGTALWAAVRDELSRTSIVEDDRARARSVLLARAERARAFFSAEATRWDHLRDRLFGDRADLQLLPGLLDGTEVVGDLGCGTGRLAELLAPFARRVIGVDRSTEMLRLARDRLSDRKNVTIEEGELEALPIQDGALDLAILSLVLHYVPQPQCALAEIRRALRPGGRILILDMLEHGRAGFREEMGHLWLGFSPDRLGEWLAEAGFEEVRWTAPPPDPGASGPLLFSLRARSAAYSGPVGPARMLER